MKRKVLIMVMLLVLLVPMVTGCFTVESYGYTHGYYVPAPPPRVIVVPSHVHHYHGHHGWRR